MKFETARSIDRVPHGGADPSMLDFSANTNPIVPDDVEAIYRDAFDASRSYPADPPADYRRAAAAYAGCEPAQIVPTPGGLAAIRLAVDLAVEEGESALLPSPSFGEYAREVRLQDGEPSFVPHDRILGADPAGHALAVVCNPNNPTGGAYDTDALEGFAARCRDAGTPLLVDEAFLGFTDRPSLAGTDGVVVARSLTKLFGLPGIRAGFAVATGAFREALESARRTWNVGGPALAVGTRCMERTDFVADTRERVRSERRRLRRALSRRYDVRPSDAPFLLVDVGARDAREVLDRAAADGIAIRDATTFRGLNSHVRVAVRLPEENDRLLEAMLDV